RAPRPAARSRGAARGRAGARLLSGRKRSSRCAARRGGRDARRKPRATRPLPARSRSLDRAYRWARPTVSLVSLEFLELLLQDIARPVEADLDRPLGHREPLRDLLHGEAVEVEERDARRVLGVELGDR